MTKVSRTTCVWAARLACGLQFIFAISACAQSTSAPIIRPGPAERLYLQLGSVGLDPAKVFRVRGSSIDRPSVHITLEDGTIAFTRDVLGKITGAFFEGDGEVLLTPPNEVERKSMSFFTGMAILEERFSTAYFRFNDDTPNELQPGFRAAEDANEFVSRWDGVAGGLAQADAMRLLSTFSNLLPTEEESAARAVMSKSDHMLHARLRGNTLGAFDVQFDSASTEQVQAGQSKAAADGSMYYNVWTAFETSGATLKSSASPVAEAESYDDTIFVRDYVIDAEVKPPTQLGAVVTLTVEMDRPARLLTFELSRYLKIQSVDCDGVPVEFIQNPSVDGTRLARHGDDLVGVIVPASSQKHREIHLQFVYAGAVLEEAGKGLLYVGARGTWYPNRHAGMSNFDMTFHYPADWTLVATGKLVTEARGRTSQSGGAAGDVQTRWISDRPIPVAGFDLGKYIHATAHSGEVKIEAYATDEVERAIKIQTEASVLDPQLSRSAPPPVQVFAPSPARNAMKVAENTANAINHYAKWFGPFPYSQLSLTQLPGRESQGWPGLVFLSSYAFLTTEERHDLHMNAAHEMADQEVPAHEAAHQWWGDLVTWRTYRDQWFSEGLASYSALMVLQEKNPGGFREVMQTYRRELMEKDKSGNLPRDAGPVTLGGRLFSSVSPNGYEAISYGRGAWLFHMLRCMLNDGAAIEARGGKRKEGSTPLTVDDPFVRSLRKIRERYEGRAITTRELLDVFAEDLPASLRYEGKASLDWFRDGWVNGTSMPKLELENVKFIPKAGEWVVTGVIRQKDAAPNLVTSIPVYAVAPGESPVLLGRVFADGADTTFHFTTPRGSHRLLLDPYQTVLTSTK